jgi:hypothetical protein
MRRVALVVLWLAGCDRLLHLDPVHVVDSGMVGGDGVSSDAPSGSSLVAWYPLDSLAAGACAHDATGHGHDGTCSGGVSAASGKIAGAFAFDGTGSIDVPDSPDLDTLAEFTIALWYYVAAAPSTTDCVFVRPDAVAYSQLLCVQHSGLEIGCSDSISFTLALPAVGQWHHLAMTWSHADNRTFRTYIDGAQLTSSMPPDVSFTAAHLWMGGDRSSGTLVNGFKGSLDDVRYYNRELSAAEISQLATP